MIRAYEHQRYGYSFSLYSGCLYRSALSHLCTIFANCHLQPLLRLSIPLCTVTPLHDFRQLPRKTAGSIIMIRAYEHQRYGYSFSLYSGCLYRAAVSHLCTIFANSHGRLQFQPLLRLSIPLCTVTPLHDFRQLPRKTAGSINMIRAYEHQRWSQPQPRFPRLIVPSWPIAGESGFLALLPPAALLILLKRQPPALSDEGVRISLSL
ncbi:hypothetical protein J6590_028675 [Homalodisca vitripennis]|nr:hypothetical protein J6590_028675 [Homalodisca vitripennis]